MPLRWLKNKCLGAGEEALSHKRARAARAEGGTHSTRSAVRLPRLFGMVPLRWFPPRYLRSHAKASSQHPSAGWHRRDAQLCQHAASTARGPIIPIKEAAVIRGRPANGATPASVDSPFAPSAVPSASGVVQVAQRAAHHRVVVGASTARLTGAAGEGQPGARRKWGRRQRRGRGAGRLRRGGWGGRCWGKRWRWGRRRCCSMKHAVAPASVCFLQQKRLVNNVARRNHDFHGDIRLQGGEACVQRTHITRIGLLTADGAADD